MKKLIYITISIFIIYCGFIFFFYANEVKYTIYHICELWLFKVLLSIIPFYFLSNILVSFPFISKISYKILDKILHFESEKSCSLLLLATITGNPTSSFMVINAVKHQEISEKEGNRLLKCTVISSPLFIFSMLEDIGVIVYIIQIIVSFVLYYKKRVSKTYRKNLISNNSIFEILDNAPYVMLSILSSMIFIGLINICLDKMFDLTGINNNYIIKYFLDLSELTTGLDNITKYNINRNIIYLLSTFLLSFGGFAIIIQLLNEVKKTSLSKTSLITYRILHGIISCLILILILIFFI